MNTHQVEESCYVYVVKLLIRHPSWPVEKIRESMEEEPSNFWTVGDKVRIGDRVLKGQYRRQTAWQVKKKKEGSRHFFKEIDDVYNKLASKKNFFDEIIATGGDVMLTIELPGKSNTGDVLSVEQMLKVSSLGISVGIEVFPEFKA